MKNGNKLVYILIALFAAVVIALAVMPGGSGGKPEHEYIRIHIRANSNSDADQRVKYSVKEAVIKYLTPLVAECVTRSDAYKVINKNLRGIERAAAASLTAAGFSYGADAELLEEYFPARAYDGVTLESGYYDALILRLGGGSGDNWWCVVYPPLCFVDSAYAGGEGVVYKSKLWEIIRRFS